MKNISKILLNFGLKEKDVETYITLLSLKHPTVTEIAFKTAMQRTAIYFHLKNLMEKGLVTETKKEKIKRFSPIPPKDLADRFQSWTTDFLSLVPEMETLQTINEETPIITVHNFKTFQYTHYNELASMPIGSEFRVIQSKESANKDFQAFTAEEWHHIVKKFIDRKIMTRAIFTDNMINDAHKEMKPETYELFKQRNWQLRVVNPERFNFEEMMIHQDKVTFLLTDVNLVLRIQHKRIVKALMAIFDALWLTGKPRKFQ
ncbi:MAG: helix-turn-helix domain-containing protein [Patescibacteria group bacterium]